MLFVDEHPSAPASGDARKLTLAWLALACAALGAAAVCAVVLVAARSPGLAQVIPQADLFRPALVQHVVLSTVIWLLACAGALASAAAARASEGLRWGLFGAAVTGAALIVVSPAAGGEALLVDYVPMVDNGFFKCGLALFACAVGASALTTVWERRTGLGEPLPERALVVWCCAPLVAAFVSLLWSAAKLPADLPAQAYYQALFWGPGHALQFAHVTYMLIAWLSLARAAGLTCAVRGRLLHAAVALSVVPVLAVPVLQSLYSPETDEFARAYTDLMRACGSLAALPAGVVLLWCAWRRRAGASASAGLLVASVLLFAGGCVIGAFIRGQTALVPAHYHGTVGAVTVAYMGVIAHALQRRGRAGAGARSVRWALWHAAGLTLLIAGLAWCGAAGMPRKLAWLSVSRTEDQIAMGLILLGGTAAMVGAAGFAATALRALIAALWTSQDGCMASRARDVRGRAFALTLATVLLGGGVLAVVMEGSGGAGPRVEASARVDPTAHADARRRVEIALRFEQAVVMLHAKRYEHAITALHRVLELSPQMPEAHVDMGYALLGLGRYAAARDFFESALALRPAQHNAYYGLAIALDELKDLAGAVGAMRTYVHLAKADDPYLRKANAALWEWQARLAESKTSVRPTMASAASR